MGQVMSIIQLNINNDSELLDEGMSYLSEACARFMDMKHPHGDVLFHMTDSILFYLENYFIDRGEEPSSLPKPTSNWRKNLTYDSST